MNEIELTQELVRINSENPPGNEKKIAKYIKDFLEDLKIQTKLIEFEKNRVNLIASIGKGKGLMLNGHMDTVPAGDLNNWKYDPFGGKTVKGKLYGLGSSDMKGGLATILIAVKNLAREDFKKKLLLTFVADEESGQTGTRYLVKNRKDIFKDIKYGLTAESNDLKITIAQKGVTHLTIKLKGKAAHGSTPELGDNAILKASDFIQELKKLTKKLKNKKNKMLGNGTISIGTINGGTKVNIVPDFCEIEVDRRLIPGETPTIALNQIKRLLKKLKIKAEIETYVNRLPMQVSKNFELIKILNKIEKFKKVGEPGYTEIELYYREAGVPCITLGPGLARLAHVSNEYIPIKNLRKAVKIYEQLIRKVCL